MSSADAHGGAGMSWFMKVWGCLIVLTAAEVFLTYEQLRLEVMLFLLMGISIVKAALIIAYFMHLRYEKRQSRSYTYPGHGLCVGDDDRHVSRIVFEFRRCD